MEDKDDKCDTIVCIDILYIKFVNVFKVALTQPASNILKSTFHWYSSDQNISFVKCQEQELFILWCSREEFMIRNAFFKDFFGKYLDHDRNYEVQLQFNL